MLKTMQLHLLDGTVEVSAAQQVRLLAHPYFASFFRWASRDQPEYTLEIPVSFLQLALGEITQRQILVQAAHQAVQETRADLDRLGLLQPVDFSASTYPLEYHDLLKCYSIAPVEPVTVSFPTLKDLDVYQIMFDWHQEVNMTDLEFITDPAEFPAYLEVFWTSKPTQFLATAFSDRLIDWIILARPVFAATLAHRIPSLEAWSRKSGQIRLVSFYAEVFGFDLDNWLKHSQNSDNSLADRQLAVKLCPDLLGQALLYSDRYDGNWDGFLSFLALVDGCSTDPLREEDRRQLSSEAQERVSEWEDKQVFSDDKPTMYLWKFSISFREQNLIMCRRIATAFPSYEFDLDINRPANIGSARSLLAEFAHLELKIKPAVYQHDLAPIELAWLLEHDPQPRLGLNRINYSPECRALLIHHQVYRHTDNVFLGQVDLMTQMIDLTLDAGLIVHSECLNEVIKLKRWDLLVKLESTYQQHGDRIGLLSQILGQPDPSPIRLLLQWENNRLK